MSKREVVVTIGLDGKVEVSAEGFRGKGCTVATKFIEEALGFDSSANRKRKPEFFATETVAQSQRT